MVVLVMLLGIVTAVINHISSVVRSSSSKLDALLSAQAAFDILAGSVSEVTLNTYWDYDSVTAPTSYVRRSDLHFVINGSAGRNGIYFQAPRAVSSVADYDQTQGVLNACGFYVEYGGDDKDSAAPGKWHRPDHVDQARYRYRLMQCLQPTEDLDIFTTPNADWIPEMRNVAWPLADNVIAMVICPRNSTVDTGRPMLSTNYGYDSRTGTAIQKGQLPPVVDITLVVLDKSAAARFCTGNTPPAEIEKLFTGLFAEVTDYAKDLETLKTGLRTAHIGYEVLTTSVVLRESKWSGE
jgi:uncharacterized protein (TIGR02599 family)